MPYFDTHCDTILKVGVDGSLERNAFDVDLQRLSQYETAAQVFAVFNEGNLPRGDMLQYLHTIHIQAGRCSFACFAEGYRDLAGNTGMVSCMSSIEGLGNSPDFSLDDIDAFYEAGARVMSLTWNQDNLLCGGIANNQSGLTALGQEALARINQKKIVIDVSHCSEAGFWDIMEGSSLPVVATHSNARAVAGHPRNLTDDQFRAIVQCGGVAGLNLCPLFLNGGITADVDDMLRHIDHFLSLGGENAVGIGADFDGIDDYPRDVTDCGKLDLLFGAMRRHGYGEALVQKIAYGNWLALFHKYE